MCVCERERERERERESIYCHLRSHKGKQCNTVIEMIGDIQRYMSTQKQQKTNSKTYLCSVTARTARSEPIRYHNSMKVGVELRC